MQGEVLGRLSGMVAERRGDSAHMTQAAAEAGQVGGDCLRGCLLQQARAWSWDAA